MKCEHETIRFEIVRQGHIQILNGILNLKVNEVCEDCGKIVDSYGKEFKEVD